MSPGAAGPWEGTWRGALSSAPVTQAQAAGNGPKLRQRRLSLDFRKHLLIHRVVKHWDRFSREAVDAPSLMVFVRPSDNSLGDVLQLSVSPELVRQLDEIVVDPSQLKYSVKYLQLIALPCHL